MILIFLLLIAKVCWILGISRYLQILALRENTMRSVLVFPLFHRGGNCGGANSGSCLKSQQSDPGVWEPSLPPSQAAMGRAPPPAHHPPPLRTVNFCFSFNTNTTSILQSSCSHLLIKARSPLVPCLTSVTALTTVVKIIFIYNLSTLLIHNLVYTYQW